jgi:precorrin-3B methylase
LPQYPLKVIDNIIRYEEKIRIMKFEDLVVWQRAARLSADIYRQLRDLKDYGFKVKVIDNIIRYEEKIRIMKFEDPNYSFRTVCPK